ncbi:hypothetical protein HAX54_004377, partial [Datura stramonium]|nr:hypothetical protein [Datura stramonium]
VDGEISQAIVYQLFIEIFNLNVEKHEIEQKYGNELISWYFLRRTLAKCQIVRFPAYMEKAGDQQTTDQHQ